MIENYYHQIKEKDFAQLKIFIRKEKYFEKQLHLKEMKY